MMGCHDTCRWRDGGRVLSGAEQFVLDAPDDGDVILLSVYHAPAAVTMTVRVNGGDVVTHNLPGIPGQFVVVPTRIPAQNRVVSLRVEIDYSPRRSDRDAVLARGLRGGSLVDGVCLDSLCASGGWP
ncbi:MAG: hypothetical protein HND48_08960 [Chloroflexi bacterium]|nr:hypothetical protein [Chloroflexota bacterium]